MVDCTDESAGKREVLTEEITLVHEVLSLTVGNFIDIVAEAVASTPPPAFDDQNSDEESEEMVYLPRALDIAGLTVNKRVKTVSDAIKHFIKAVTSDESLLRVRVVRCGKILT